MSWAGVAIAGIGAAGGIASSAMNKGKGKSGVTGPQVVQMPTYPWTEGLQKTSADFISQNIERMSEGKFPQYFEKASPQIREGMGRQLRETFYGSPMGGPGIMDTVRSAGAATGAGPASTIQQTNKAAQAYATKSQEIDEYMAKLGVGIMQKDAYSFPALAQNQAKGPDAKVIGGQGYNIPPDTSMTDAFSGIAASLPWLMDQNQVGGNPQDMNDYSGLNRNIGGAGLFDDIGGQYDSSRDQGAFDIFNTFEDMYGGDQLGSPWGGSPVSSTIQGQAPQAGGGGGYYDWLGGQIQSTGPGQMWQSGYAQRGY